MKLDNAYQANQTEGMKKTKTMEMMSLYDYLGRAAGPDLGQQVAQSAAKSKPRPKMETRYVNQGGYKGDVILYPKWFLDEYFGGGKNESKGNNKQLLFG